MIVGIIVCAVIWILAISYVRMRDKIPFKERDGFEKFLMVFLLALLILNVLLLINNTRIKANELNDCIRFYRYFPYAPDNEFYFIEETCYKYYSEEDINRLKQSGIDWNKKQMEDLGYIPKLNIGENESER